MTALRNSEVEVKRLNKKIAHARSQLMTKAVLAALPARKRDHIADQLIKWGRRANALVLQASDLRTHWKI